MMVRTYGLGGGGFDIMSSDSMGIKRGKDIPPGNVEPKKVDPGRPGGPDDEKPDDLDPVHPDKPDGDFEIELPDVGSDDGDNGNGNGNGASPLDDYGLLGAIALLAVGITLLG